MKLPDFYVRSKRLLSIMSLQEEELKVIDEEEDEALERWEEKQEEVEYHEEGGMKSSLLMKLDPKKREVVKELLGVAKKQYEQAFALTFKRVAHIHYVQVHRRKSRRREERSPTPKRSHAEGALLQIESWALG